MALEAPVTDDRPIWDVWLSMWWLPAVTAADELGVFDALAARPATAAELAASLGLDDRGARILLPLLASLGLLACHGGRYSAAAPAREFLRKDGPFYWGGVFARQGRTNPLHALVVRALAGRGARPVGQSSESPPVEAWERGQLEPDQARQIARFMHSHSAPAAAGLARSRLLAGARRLLDVGGGSGCFAIALAQQDPQLRCTVMDLAPMCALAREYIEAAGLGDRVETQPADMFRDEWPAGHDAVFFSNIFHDWSDGTCAELAARAHAALPSGGRIFLHEMLLDEGGAGPRTAAAFGMLMLIATRGRQFTFSDLRAILAGAGFVDITAAAAYGYYSLVAASKP